MSKKIFAVLLVALLLVGLVQAQESINPGDTVIATYSGEPVDYALTLDAGVIVQIDMMSEDFDSYISVLDAAGVELASDDDGGDFPNSRLRFAAPESATYTLRATVSPFVSEVTEGSYTLSVMSVSVVPLEMNSEAQFDPTGESQVYFSFEGSAGDVVNISAVSEDDTSLTLFDPMNEEIANNDDGGLGANPYLRRIELPADGVYTVELAIVLSDVFENPAVLRLEATEQLILGSEPIALTLGGETDEEILVLPDPEPGVYRFTVDSEEVVEYLTVDIQTEMGFFAESSVSFSNLLGGAFDVLVEPDSPDLRIVLRFSQFFSSETVTVTLGVGPR